MTQHFITVLAIPFCIACGNQSSNPSLASDNMPATPTQRSFSGMSVGEVLHAKYQEAVLNCELRTQKGSRIDSKSGPQDSLSFDLLHSELFPSNLQPVTFTLEGSADHRHTFAILLTIEDIKILDSISLPAGENGSSTELRSTPLIELNYRYQDKLIDQKQIASTSTGEGVSKVYENNEDTVFTLEYRPDHETSTYFIDLRCLLKTVPKS